MASQSFEFDSVSLRSHSYPQLLFFFCHLSFFKPQIPTRPIILPQLNSFRKMKNKYLFALPCIGLLLQSPIAALPSEATASTPLKETKEQHDARMGWWRDAKFGMFIHWGVYAVPAGFYQGKPVKSLGEWIMFNAKVPVAEYQAFAKEFNPVKYNADAWVRMARDAGMKYIIITSKHHDGFALFDSKASQWNVVQSTPYGKDLLAPLADACRKYGIKLGFYYSQAQDWSNGGSALGAGKWDKAQERSMDDYIDKIAVPQVREILTHYGKDIPAVIWWDTPGNMNTERATKIYEAVQELRPGIIMNNRLGGGFRGDTETPEQKIPATGFKDRDWETCMTMNDTWGYKKDDNQWKITETLLHNLIDVASKGGNYLLNVGPTAVGLIPEPSIQRLAEVGRWMKTNGEAIYGTSASPFSRLTWGRATTKKGPDGSTTLFLHVFDWPKDGKLVVPGLKNAPGQVTLIEGGQALSVKQSGNDWQITVPAEAPDKIATVIKAVIQGVPDVENLAPAK